MGLFCVALNYEKKLIKTLRGLGFKTVKTFSRRLDHGPGSLKMMFLDMDHRKKKPEGQIPIVAG
jgi:hypothetical protein